MINHRKVPPEPVSFFFPTSKLGYGMRMALNQLDFYMDASRAAKETGISYLSNMPIWGPVYFLRSMKYVDQVLGNADRFPHAQIEMSRSKRFLGEGILTSDGVAWKHARRQLSRPFSVTSISTMLGAIQHEVIECVKKWPIGIPFDLNQALSEMVLRIFARVILGAQTPEEMNAIGELSKTIKSFMHLLFLDFIAPRPMSPYLPAFKRNHQKIQQFLYGMIDQRSVKQEESGQNMRNNLLSILLSAGTDLTTPQIEMNLRQLFMAANDTSSAALGSALYFLMENPDWEERVYQEAQLLLGNDQLTFEQLNGCGFNDIRRVKRETLRLLPPGYLRTREAAYDEYLGEYHIPRGSIIFVSPYTLHRMEENFPVPGIFSPDKNFPDGQKPPKAYLPFLDGKHHVCLGINLAKAQIMIGMANITQRLRLELAPGTKPKVNAGAVLGMSNLRVIAKKR